MKKIYLIGMLIFSLSANQVFAAASIATKETYKPETPKDFSPITWASSKGISSFYKAPKDNGAIDFITRIYLPQNQISFILSKDDIIDLSPFAGEPIAISADTVPNNDIDSFHNLSFKRLGAETGKAIDPEMKFIWDSQFFNMKSGSSDLSMAIKYSFDDKTIISSGSRSAADMKFDRKMLIINNKTGKAIIRDFDQSIFIDNKVGDQALEGFSPTLEKSDNSSALASRLFLGVSDGGKELVVYCSQLASVKDASNALITAGIKIENQLQADGGGSAACGYNLPGQFFVEPTRTLPLLMGAKTVLSRGKIISNDTNVRDLPSKKGKVVTKLSKDTEITIFEEKDGWCRVGINQWILKALIK